MLRGAVGDERDRVAALCAGNPLLLGQVAAALRAGEGIPDPRAQASWARRLLLSHLAGLSEPTRGYLRAAAVLGRRFRPEVAAQVAGLAAADAAVAQEAFAASGLGRDEVPAAHACPEACSRSRFCMTLPGSSQISPVSVTTRGPVLRDVLARRHPHVTGENPNDRTAVAARPRNRIPSPAEGVLFQRRHRVRRLVLPRNQRRLRDHDRRFRGDQGAGHGPVRRPLR